jgi:hypothetical protein
MKYTFESRTEAHTVSGSRILIPDQVDADQRYFADFDASFPARRIDGTRCRARLVPDAYDLYGSGTGDTVVRIV